MSEVKRHSVSGYGRQDICYNDPEGEFVYHEDYAALKAERDALAAENSSLKVTCLSLAGECAQAAGEAELTMQSIKTPTTDAYLNSVRADAVVNAAAHLGDMAAGKSASTAELIKSCGRALLAFANQLRAGDPS